MIRLGRQIIGAILLLILVQMVNNAATSQALRNEGMWWLTYTAPILGVAIGIGLLALSQRSRRRPRAMAGAAA